MVKYTSNFFIFFFDNWIFSFITFSRKTFPEVVLNLILLIFFLGHNPAMLTILIAAYDYISIQTQAHQQTAQQYAMIFKVGLSFYQNSVKFIPNFSFLT